MLLGQVEHAGDHGCPLHRVRGSQGTELAASTLLVLDWSYFSGEAHLGYHQDTHLGARGALSTLRVVSRSEKAVDKARKSMGKPACTPEMRSYYVLYVLKLILYNTAWYYHIYSFYF